MDGAASGFRKVGTVVLPVLKLAGKATFAVAEEAAKRDIATKIKGGRGPLFYEFLAAKGGLNVRPGFESRTGNPALRIQRPMFPVDQQTHQK